MKKSIAVVFTAFISTIGWSQVVEQTLYINQGVLAVADGSEVPYYAFNQTDVFSLNTAKVILAPGESLALKVVNNDDATHGFTLDGSTNGPATILAGDSAVFNLETSELDVFRFYDHTNEYSYLGLAGFVAVTTESNHDYFWEFRTHDSNWNTLLDEGGTVNWEEYYPDYYTINNLSYPAISDDPMANLTGNVGDVIHIFMVNSGKSMHSMHFHGYHCTVLKSSRDAATVGRSKDTFALWSGDVTILELVPNQPGSFPVHDHNLTSISGGGIYLNGAALIIITID